MEEDYGQAVVEVCCISCIQERAGGRGENVTFFGVALEMLCVHGDGRMVFWEKNCKWEWKEVVCLLT